MLLGAVAVARETPLDRARSVTWTLLNHIRTIASIAASACFVLALRAV
jgi:uncharacterized membrane protein